MWNYSLEILSLVIISFIMLFYYSLPRLSVQTNRYFVCLLAVDYLSIVTNIAAGIVESNIVGHSLAVLHLASVLSIIAFLLMSATFSLYACSVFRIPKIVVLKNALIAHIPLFISVILTVVSPLTGFMYYIRDGKCNNGPLYFIVHLVFGYYLFLAYTALVFFRDNVRRRRHYFAMIMYVGIFTIGFLFKIILPQYLVMDSASTIAILVVYLAFQNPEFYLEVRREVFNRSAFRDYMDENSRKLDYKLIGVSIKNFNEMRDIYGGRQIDNGAVLIGEYLAKTFPDMIVFCIRMGKFLLLSRGNADYKKVIETINERFVSAWSDKDLELYLKAGYLYMDINNNVESADVVFSALAYSFEKTETMNPGECLIVSNELIKDNEHETLIKKCLESAIDNDMVEVFLQPLIDAKTDHITGAEALCRIRDNEGNIISPAMFIPIAESNGRINELGEQVFRKTCRFISENDINRLGMSWINVNLSPVQLLNVDIADRYESIMREYSIDPEMVHLEITEESMVDEVLLHDQIHNMRSRGFRFVLDDYGTGYSNVARLQQADFICIKLDMSVVWEFYRNPNSIIPSMVAAFKSMGFSVTAEGIENPDMAKVMKEAGVDYFQGYYYSEPLPIEEFIRKYEF